MCVYVRACVHMQGAGGVIWHIRSNHIGARVLQEQQHTLLLEGNANLERRRGREKRVGTKKRGGGGRGEYRLLEVQRFVVSESYSGCLAHNVAALVRRPLHHRVGRARGDRALCACG